MPGKRFLNARIAAHDEILKILSISWLTRTIFPVTILFKLVITKCEDGDSQMTLGSFRESVVAANRYCSQMRIPPEQMPPKTGPVPASRGRRQAPLQAEGLMEPDQKVHALMELVSNQQAVSESRWQLRTGTAEKTRLTPEH